MGESFGKQGVECRQWVSLGQGLLCWDCESIWRTYLSTAGDDALVCSAWRGVNPGTDQSRTRMWPVALEKMLWKLDLKGGREGAGRRCPDRRWARGQLEMPGACGEWGQEAGH